LKYLRIFVVFSVNSSLILVAIAMFMQFHGSKTQNVTGNLSKDIRNFCISEQLF